MRGAEGEREKSTGGGGRPPLASPYQKGEEEEEERALCTASIQRGTHSYQGAN